MAASRSFRRLAAPLLARLRTDRATGILFGVWVIAVGATFAGGAVGDGVQSLVEAIIFGLLIFATVRVTDDAVAPPRAPHPVVATVILAIVPVLTGSGPAAYELPGWKLIPPAADWLAAHARIIDRFALTNTIAYVVVPAVLLIPLGWGLRQWGGGASRRGTRRALVIWCTLPLAGFVVASLVLGHPTPLRLLRDMWSDIFENGFAEEALWRGGVLTALCRWWRPSIANGLQAIGFGLWHLRANLADAHGAVWLALAIGVATQGFYGWTAGVVTRRTGNILVAGAFHAIVDAGSAFES